MEPLDRSKFHERNISIFRDSIPKELRWKELNSSLKFGKARLSGFPGANTKQLSSYTDVNLENINYNTEVIHVGINDLLNESNEPQIDSLIQNIGIIVKKCRCYEIKSILVSDLVYTTRLKLSVLDETYKRFEVFCRNKGVILIDNRNIRGQYLYRYGLHLIESGKRILAKSHTAYLNIFLGRTQYLEE